MRAVALISGGKDSVHALALAAAAGHEVVALANLLPPAPTDTDELDSFMYQTVGHQLVAAFAACTGLPLYRRAITGAARQQSLAYEATQGDEVEDLTALLAFVKARHPDVQAVTSGAIASDYQRLRVESVCSRLGLVSLAYLWHQPQDALLSAMAAAGLQAVLVKVAAIGLDPAKHLGRPLAQLQPHLRALAARFGCNVCGEGGEYETLALDCAAFVHGRIVLDEWRVVLHSPDSIAPVGVLHPMAFHVEPKQPGQAQPPEGCVVQVPPDWVPPPSPAAPPDAAASAGAGWLAELAVSDSGGHAHITCSVAAPGGAGAAARAPSAADTAGALHAALAAVGAALPGLGLAWGHACFVHLYLADMTHFGPANEAYCQHLPQVSPPSRACVQAPLPPGCPVLLDVLLARPQQQQQQQQQRRVLHVQSISDWAPSCIGPYSQATACAGLVHMAGQIPLDPGSMTLVAAPQPGQAQAARRAALAAQAWRTLRSCQAVAVGVRSCFARASLGLTVYLSEAAADAGGQALVQAALAAAWADWRCLDRTQLPRALAAAVGLDEGSSGPLNGAAAACGGSRSRSSSRSSRCSSEGEVGGSGEAALPPDEYLLPPPVPAPVQAAVAFVTVPALPRGALLEVQPLLLDLAGVPAGAQESSSGSSSSSSSDQDGAKQGRRGSRAAAAQPSSRLQSASAGVQVHVLAAALGPARRWCRLLCSVEQQPGSAQEVAAAAAAQIAAAVQQEQQLWAGGLRRSSRARARSSQAVQLVSLRCWHVAAGAGGRAAAAAWSAALVAELQARSLAGGDAAAQLVPVSQLGWSAGGQGSSSCCWALAEALVLLA